MIFVKYTYSNSNECRSTREEKNQRFYAWYNKLYQNSEMTLTEAFWAVNLLTDGALATDDAAAAAATRIL
jgi:hypothetical protein